MLINSECKYCFVKRKISEVEKGFSNLWSVGLVGICVGFDFFISVNYYVWIIMVCVIGVGYRKLGIILCRSLA